MNSNTVKYHIHYPDFKVIIFDLNGTITNSVSQDPRHLIYRNSYIESKINQPVDKNLTKVTSEALARYGLNVEEYYKYRNTHIGWEQFHSFNSITYDVIKELHHLGYKLVLYTNCYREQIEHTLSILKVKHPFNLIISKELGYTKPNSKAFEFIAKKMNVKLTELLMVANEWEKDLAPLANKGGNVIWIKSEKYLSAIMKVAKNINETKNVLDMDTYP